MRHGPRVGSSGPRASSTSRAVSSSWNSSPRIATCARRTAVQLCYSGPLWILQQAGAPMRSGLSRNQSCSVTLHSPRGRCSGRLTRRRSGWARRRCRGHLLARPSPQREGLLRKVIFGLLIRKDGPRTFGCAILATYLVGFWGELWRTRGTGRRHGACSGRLQESSLRDRLCWSYGRVPRRSVKRLLPRSASGTNHRDVVAVDARCHPRRRPGRKASLNHGGC